MDDRLERARRCLLLVDPDHPETREQEFTWQWGRFAWCAARVEWRLFHLPRGNRRDWERFEYKRVFWGIWWRVKGKDQN